MISSRGRSQLGSVTQMGDDVDDGFAGPTWQPTPTERFSESARKRLAGTDYTDTLLTLAACVVIVGPVISTMIQQYRLWHFGQFSALDAFFVGGRSLSVQFRLLLPALAVLMIRSCRRPAIKLRMVLRVATLASAACTVFYVGRALSDITMLTNSGERRTLMLSAIGIAALVVANLAIVFNDQEGLS